ncbi:hypothetical protein [Cecembia lonarensis]|uniref:Uncharacterized protein n=1 Tax=Cecembia lonarensis (strain CCUG 58316 / KCTC 22772 / LW9) TaxID=1225176 RepID=K1LJ50_CECL9|nr:hypothetical protein [Cecembia lonarensis]EKB50303.1 hypothetical protein B879_01011 [Cecembia lonarensis LW9]
MLNKNLIRLEVLNYENDPEGKFRKVRLGDETIEVWLNLDIIKYPDPEVLSVTGNIQIHKEGQPVLTEKIIGTCGC